ncbi:MAG: UDP-N-acetylmuramoyl-L-alanine--D-glutamate ligase, partial [Planctomycetota bacterium]|nr:UDP-N-acetylmuramoyl-L-alanine--D-glutamate ligase [Planctomycetota bacterium]
MNPAVTAATISAAFAATRALMGGTAHDSFEGKRVTVMGLGHFGGGAAVTRWFCNQGAHVTLTDLSPADKLAGSLAQINDLLDAGKVTLALGGHEVAHFTSCDLVVANPAVPRPWENQYIKAAEEAKVPVTTEIRLVIERLPDPSRIIGITGSAGKSTTSAMIAHVLRAQLGADRVRFGGNIGGSLLGELEQMRQGAGEGARHWTVLELSSAMLYWLGKGIGYPHALGWAPRLAVLTNLSDNHGDWHGGFDHYADSKCNIFKFQQPGSVALCADHGPAVTTRLEALGVHPTFIDPQPSSSDAAAVLEHLKLRIPGLHNRLNARVACAVASEALTLDGVAAPLPTLLDHVSSFPGLPHRLQLVHESKSVRWFNDSKSTTPESALLAVNAFSKEGGEGGPQTVHLIAGGYDKH